MQSFHPKRGSFALLILTVEAALAVLLIVIGSAADREGRSGGPESAVVAYAAAIGREDLDGALAQLAPKLRDQSAAFVQNQLGNHYTFLGSAVQTDSLLDRLFGRTTGQTRVLVTMEIQESGGAPWRSDLDLPVQLSDGRWYLLQTPLRLD